MRSTYNAEILKNENGEFLGINLGADYCSEHEWGIDGIRQSLGVGLPKKQNKKLLEKVKDKVLFKNVSDDKAFGLRRLLVSDFSKELKFYKWYGKKKKVHYTLGLYGSDTDLAKADYTFYFPSNREISAAWDSREFEITVHKENKKYLEELYNSFSNCDIAVGVFGRNAFSNGGLCLLIASRIDTKLLDEWYQKDKESYELKIEAEKTGIYSYLKNHNKGYFALEPRYFQETADEKPIIKFFLNPIDQLKYNSGWFSVDELKSWCQEEGPVIKSYD